MSSTTIPTPDPNSIAWNEYLDTQNFNVTSLDGTPVTLNLALLRTFISSSVQTSIIYGFGIGFCAMLAIVLLLLTDRKKLHRPIYILNIATLVLYAFRSILQAIIACSTGSSVGMQVLGAVVLPTSRYWAYIAAYTIQPFLYASIVMSLVLQVRVVFAAEPRTQRAITAFLFVSGLGMVILQTYFCIRCIIVDATNPTSNVPIISRLYQIMRIYFCTYVGVSCLVFLYKLGVTIRRRRKMGIRKFGPLQIIFIMFSQCLVVPRISILKFADVSCLIHRRPE
jgi:pheromone alpha factor receptor